jgi:hypothetical protein
MLMGRHPPLAHGSIMVCHHPVICLLRTLTGCHPATAHPNTIGRHPLMCLLRTHMGRLPAPVHHHSVMNSRRTLMGRLPSTVRQLSTLGHRAPTSHRQTQFRPCRRARTPGA